MRRFDWTRSFNNLGSDASDAILGAAELGNGHTINGVLRAHIEVRWSPEINSRRFPELTASSTIGLTDHRRR